MNQEINSQPNETTVPESTVLTADDKRFDKLEILRKNGYSPERIDAIENETPLPLVPNDLVEGIEPE